MSLEGAISKLSLYDAKRYFRKAQNVVFNYTDIEAKVREATNNEPWGASSSLMSSIAHATYNHKERAEIMGMIFNRLFDKSAREWRQIYKALQLLEYLIKNGCESFIDDARLHLRTICMLESFQYIDSQGRDQGVNVRNRAKAVGRLLDDDILIRAERKKARQNSEKYKGIGGEIPLRISGNKINPSAGFSRSTLHGISISADYDSEEEKMNNNGKPVPLSSQTHVTFHNDDFRPKKSSDEDFWDFQSAVPIPKSPRTASESLADIERLYHQESSNLLLDLGFQEYDSNQSLTCPVNPASSRDKDVLFGSLFDSAKRGLISQSKVFSGTSTTVPGSSTHCRDFEQNIENKKHSIEGKDD